MTKTKTTYYILLNLQMFADGGGEGGATGAEGGTQTGVTAGAADLNSIRAKNNPLANVQYGKGAEQDAAATTPSRDDQFKALIKGEWKEEYGKVMQETIQKRLKANQEAADRGNAFLPVMDLLSQKYGVDSADVDAIVQAIQDDDSLYEDEALESGMSVSQLKEIRRVEKENAALKAEIQNREMQKKMDADIQRWNEQTEQAKRIFPNLDLEAELQNEQFRALLKSGVDVSAAYQVVHQAEIVPQMMTYAAQQTEQKLTNKIRSNAARPVENGLRGQSPALVKNSVAQLTKADMKEINRRVAMGDKNIRF